MFSSNPQSGTWTPKASWFWGHICKTVEGVFCYVVWVFCSDVSDGRVDNCFIVFICSVHIVIEGPPWGWNRIIGGEYGLISSTRILSSIPTSD